MKWRKEKSIHYDCETKRKGKVTVEQNKITWYCEKMLMNMQRSECEWMKELICRKVQIAVIWTVVEAFEDKNPYISESYALRSSEL